MNYFTTPGIKSREHVIDALCSCFELDKDMLLGKSRKREVADARCVGIWFISTLKKHSTTEIGLAFHRDHATVIASRKKYARLINDKEFKLKIDRFLEYSSEKTLYI